ncbi:hypothetical protein ABZ622_24380 [Streptomyces sp. NPDC007164]
MREVFGVETSTTRHDDGVVRIAYAARPLANVEERTAAEASFSGN